MKKKGVILTGAGISAESGIKTFRDSNGLWEGHDVMEVASVEGWNNNPSLVLDFYNKRRSELRTVHPNKAHFDLVTLEDAFDITIITQNVDNLHERAGSTKIIHLHGELLKAKSIRDDHNIIDWEEDILLGDTDKNGHQLRPHIVWFGEAVPAMDEAMIVTEQADFIVVIGTSMQVYPAAGLISYAKTKVPIYYIDPKPASISNGNNPIEIIALKATEGVAALISKLKHLE